MVSLSFNNDPSLKEELLKRVKAHVKADRIIKGTYWENGKGCAIGCMVETKIYPHHALQLQYGIPVWLGRVIDAIFENLPNEAKFYPLLIINAIPIGINLNKIKRYFIIYILEFALKIVKNEYASEKLSPLLNVLTLYKNNENNRDLFDNGLITAVAILNDDVIAGYCNHSTHIAINAYGAFYNSFGNEEMAKIAILTAHLLSENFDTRQSRWYQFNSELISLLSNINNFSDIITEGE